MSKKTFKQRFSDLFKRKQVESNDTTKRSGVISADAIDEAISKSSEFEDKYLFDFLNYSSGYIGVEDAGSHLDTQEERDAKIKAKKEADSRKLVVKPKDVLGELETIPTPFNLKNLDDKIEILKDKSELITQYYAKREVKGLIERLENRKLYLENRTFFDNYQNTTDENIDKLLEGYKLVMKTSDIFIPEFPDDAIAVMKLYTEKCSELFDKKPVFYVIAEESKFRKSYEKRDPILLVQSPFGFYWQILGAWDEEMVLLNSL